MGLKAKLKLAVELIEYVTGDLGATVKRHVLDASATRENGSTSGKAQYGWSDTRSVTAGTPDSIDLRGSLTAADGSSLAFAPVVGIMVRNKSATSGQNLEIGGGSNSWLTWVKASGDAVVVGPGGTFVLESPVDGYATTVGTGDLLQIVSSSGTIEYDIVVWGR